MFQQALETMFRRFGQAATLITAGDPEISVIVLSTPEEMPNIEPEAKRRDQFLNFDILQADYPNPSTDDVLKIGNNFHRIASFVSPDAENRIWTLEVERYHGQSQI